MKRSVILTAVAIVLALTALGSFLVYFFAAPTPLRVAVGPFGGEDQRLIAAFTQTFAKERQGVRLRMVSTDGPTASAEVFANGKADLAILRSDGPMPPNAATVAIMHRDVVVVLAPAASGVATINQLAGKRVGIVRGFNLNGKLLNFVLERSGVDPNAVTKVSVRPQDVRTMALEGRIDAIFAVAPVNSNLLSTIHTDLFSEKGEPPVIVPIAEAEAIVQRNPLLENFNLLRGTFGGAPPRPAENIPTIAVTHRLVADRYLKDGVVGDLAKALFESRQAVAVDAPAGARIEQPNTEAPGPLVIHPGAAAYFDGEQKSFIEQYGEWIYLGVMGVSLIGSLGAALLSRNLGERRPSGKSDLDRMLMLLRRTRTADTYDALDELQREADESFARMVERAARSEIDEPVMSAFTIALGEVRAAIEVRRGALSNEAMASLAE